MAESLQGIRALPMGDVQSILEGESENDSQHLLSQVPDATVDTTGLSSICQNLSSSFNCLRRGLASHIGRHTNQSQNPVDMEVDVEQLSPTSLHTQLAVKDLHNQNNHNAELLRRLETIVLEKESEISRL